MAIPYLTPNQIQNARIRKMGNPSPQLIPITEQSLIAHGFECTNLGIEPPYKVFQKCGFEVWGFDDFWLIDVLEEMEIDIRFHHMRELAVFFTTCGVDIEKGKTSNVVPIHKMDDET